MANGEDKASLIKIRRDTKENWTELNPLLEEGEIGIEWNNDTKTVCNIKIGNGQTYWRDLPYFSGNDIPYSNITGLPTINGIAVEGTKTSTDYGIQSIGNYPTVSAVEDLINSKAEHAQYTGDDAIPTPNSIGAAILELNNKIDELDTNQVPDINNKEGKFLKVVNSDNTLKMAWSDLDETVVTQDYLDGKLEGYVQSENGKSLVSDSDYQSLKNDVNNIKNLDPVGMSENITIINNALGYGSTPEDRIVAYKEEIENLVSTDYLKKVLTGDDSGQTPYSETGYISRTELATKADDSVLQGHISSVDSQEAKSSKNPHGITKETIGLGNVGNYAAANIDLSNLSDDGELRFSKKQDKLNIKYDSNNKPIDGIDIIKEATDDGVISYLVNTDKGSEVTWNSIKGTPASLIDGNKQTFQADWNNTETTSLGYIRNKPDLSQYVTPDTLPIASSTKLGAIKIGEKFSVDSEGKLDLILGVNNYDSLDNKPSFLAAKYDEDGNIITDDEGKIEYEEYVLRKGMIPAEMNLASLSVAKAIDDRLEEEKAGRDELQRLQDQVNRIAPDAENMVTRDELQRDYYNSTTIDDLLSYKADSARVYDIDHSYSKDYLNVVFSDINNDLDYLKDNFENRNNKKDTIHGFLEDDLKIYYPSLFAVEEITDELKEDYNTKITTETNRATAAEEAISNDLHTNYYTKPEVDTLVSSVYKFKGTVLSYGLLPPSEDNVEGDVWNIIQADPEHDIKAGDNVAWVDEKDGVEAHWDVLAGITDLSNYYTKQEANNKFVDKTTYDAKVEEIESNMDDMGAEVTAELATKADVANTLEGYGITDAYTKVDTEVLVNNAVNNKAEQAELDAVTYPMVYRGTVELYDNLPSSGVALNDLYVVSSTRQYYAWDGTTWVRQPSIGEKADKTSVYTKTEIDTNFATKTLVNTKADITSLNAHTNNKANPHEVTKAQIGLGNVDNTSDLGKPISTATQLALNGKQNNLTPTQLDAVNSGATADRINSYETAVTTTIPTLATKSALAEVKQTADAAAAALPSKANANNVYTKAEVDAKLSSAMHFKGSVATVGDLDNIQNPEVGDMYNVTASGANYAWTGNVWDKLSEVVDLTVYYTKSEIDDFISDLDEDVSNLETNLQAQINNKQDTLIAGANITIENNVIRANVNGTLATKLSELENDTHFITLNDVPDVNDGILTIQKNGADIGTFNANSSTDATINIVVPTTVAELTDANSYAAKNELATVATTGNYNDLFNTPDAPKDGILTIQKNGLTLDTFSANSAVSKTIDIIVPTTVAQLSDASNYATVSDATYTAGTGISIENNVISNTQTSAEWGNITGTLSNQTDLNSALSAKANSSDLALVATTGSYNNLTDKPTIPTTVAELTDASDYVTNEDLTDTLADVATSGDYDDLINKPTIPSTVAELTDASNYALVSSLATVAASGSYNDLSDKPTIPTTVAQLSDANDYTLKSSLKTVATTGSYNDLTDKPTIPTTVAELSDASDYATVTQLNTKQNTLTAGENITIENNVISSSQTKIKFKDWTK